MNPGRMKDKVPINQLAQTIDAEGTVIDTYTQFIKRFADVRPARGREAYVNDQFLSEIDFVVSMRYDSQTKNITAKHEVDFKGQRLRITSPPINVENRDKELRLFCSRITDSGR